MAMLTPRQIVTELDRYIVGQDEAKRAVAVALRNRYRRKQLPEEIREEVTPKNILMIGPTGVGKTEIARRLAKLVTAPFVKVEATKFTEVGYVGRDVDSIIRDLVEASIRMVKEEHTERVREAARAGAEHAGSGRAGDHRNHREGKHPCAGRSCADRGYRLSPGSGGVGGHRKHRRGEHECAGYSCTGRGYRLSVGDRRAGRKCADRRFL